MKLEKRTAQASIGPRGQLIVETPKGRATFWIHKEPFVDDGSSYSERIKSQYPTIKTGQTLFSPKAWLPEASVLGFEQLNLSDAQKEIVRICAKHKFPLPDLYKQIRANLTYSNPGWDEKQPEFDPEHRTQKQNFLQKLSTVRDFAQETIDKTLTPEREKEFRDTIREIDENTPIHGVKPINSKDLDVDLADTILDLWERYKTNPSKALLDQISALRAKL